MNYRYQIVQILDGKKEIVEYTDNKEYATNYAREGFDRFGHLGYSYVVELTDYGKREFEKENYCKCDMCGMTIMRAEPKRCDVCRHIYMWIRSHPTMAINIAKKFMQDVASASEVTYVGKTDEIQGG